MYVLQILKKLYSVFNIKPEQSGNEWHDTAGCGGFLENDVAVLEGGIPPTS